LLSIGIQYSYLLIIYSYLLRNVRHKIIITTTTITAILGLCFTGQLLQKHAGLSLAFWDHWRTIFHTAGSAVLVA